MTLTDREALCVSAPSPGRASTTQARETAWPEDRLTARTRIIQNVSVLGAAQLVTWAAMAGVTIMLPRYLGDENLGKFTTATSLTDLCGLLAGLGVTNYLIKEVARKGVAARSELVNALAMRLPTTLVACGLAALAATLLGYDLLTRQAVYLFCLGIALGAVGGVLGGALQGMQEMRPVALAGALHKMALVGLIAVAVLGDYGLVGVALAWNLAGIATVTVYLVALLRRGGLGGRLDFRSWRGIFLGSIPFFVWQSAHLVYGQVDVILLSVLTRDAVVGWYGAAYRLVSIPVFIPAIVASAVAPAMVRSASHDPVGFGEITRRSLHIVLLLTIPMALGTMVIAEPLLEFVRYPEAFRNAIPLIVILAIHIPLMGADMIIGNALIACDRQRLWALTGVTAAVLNPSINLLLIPHFDRTFGNGAIGAATSTVLTELFMMAMGLRLLRGELLDRASLSFGLKCMLAGLLMAGIVWLARDVFLPLTIAIGALVYFSASFALGTVSVRDVRLLRSYVLRRHGARADAFV